MDELELLKQDWKRQEKALPYVKSNEIGQMLHKKSTSIVRWIFLISIAEFIFWIFIESLTLFTDSYNIIDEIGLSLFYRVVLIINYIMIVVFIGLFYRNYKRISTNDSVKELMKNIIITRKTVKYYVWFNLILFTISFFVSSYYSMQQVIGNESTNIKLITIGFLLLLLVVILSFFIGFYVLLYGILTKRLYRNYKELKKIETNV